MSKPEKNITPSITIVIPTVGRTTLKKAKDSCGTLPVEVERDNLGTGAGPTRNRAIKRVKTDWVAFLDDDDQLTHLESLQGGISEDADCVIFRAQYPDGTLLPKVPVVEWGNVPISFAVKTSVAKEFPFVKGSNEFRQNEDYLFVKTLEENGKKIVFSPHVTYLVKPSSEAQESANKYHS